MTNAGKKKSEKCIKLKRTTNVILLSSTKVDNATGNAKSTSSNTKTTITLHIKAKQIM